MLETIKLAVFDLDGTLLDSNDSLIEKNIAALQALSQAGVRIMLNSGRAPSMVKAYFYEAGVRGSFSSANGAYIEDDTGKIIYRKRIPEELMDDLVRNLLQEKISFSVMTEQNLYSNFAGEKIHHRFMKYELLAGKYGVPFPLILNDVVSLNWKRIPVYKIAVMEQEEDQIEEKIKFLKNLSDQIQVTRSGPHVIDVTAVGVSKGMAVKLMGKHYGIRKEMTACMGDYDNDIPMFREAGISVAMGNAPAYVKECADYVTEDNNSGGAANAIMRYLIPQVGEETI